MGPRRQASEIDNRLQLSGKVESFSTREIEVDEECFGWGRGAGAVGMLFPPTGIALMTIMFGFDIATGSGCCDPYWFKDFGRMARPPLFRF